MNARDKRPRPGCAIAYGLPQPLFPREHAAPPAPPARAVTTLIGTAAKDSSNKQQATANRERATMATIDEVRMIYETGGSDAAVARLLDLSESQVRMARELQLDARRLLAFAEDAKRGGGEAGARAGRIAGGGK